MSLHLGNLWGLDFKIHHDILLVIINEGLLPIL